MKLNYLKFLTILALIVTTNMTVTAQNIEVHIGNEAKASKRESVKSIFPTKDGAIAIKSQPKLLGINSLSIEVLDKSMNIINRNDFESPERDLNMTKMTFVNEKLYVFMDRYDSKSNLNSIYGTTISIDGKFNNDIIEIAQVHADSRRKSNSFDVSLSADSSQFLITIAPSIKDKGQMGERHFITINQAFEEEDNIKIKFPFKERDFDINSKYLDQFGNIHMLCGVNIEESKRNSIFKTESEKEARIFTVYKGENEIKEYQINFLNDDAGFISQLKMKTDKLGKLQCTGFYSDKFGNSTKGVFVFTVDLETKEISNSTSQSFTDEYLNQFLSERQIRKKERKKDKKHNPYDRLYNYKIRDIVMKEGGGFYIVAEYYLFRISTTTDSKGNTRTTYHYYYDDLMVINVESNNEVSWYSKVPKKQYSTNDDGRFSGIVTGINHDNSLNIIFNDNEEYANVLAPENHKRVNFKKSKVVLVKFEEDGKATKTPLFGGNKSKMYVVPSASPKGKQNDLILYSKGKRTNKFVNVILK